jgi:hypothetical protein
MTSGLFATVVKEKKRDPDDPPAKGLAGLWERMREHPLAVAAAGYTVSTAFHAGSTWKAYREAKRTGDQLRLRSVPGRALFVSMAFLSEFLLAISSKGHGEGVQSDASVRDSALSLAADMVASQPRDTQAALVDSLADFMSRPDVLAMKNERARALLHEQVEAMRRNPWMEAFRCDKALPEDTQAQSMQWREAVKAAPPPSLARS